MKKIEVFFIISILMVVSIGNYSGAQKIRKKDNYPVDINKYEFLRYSGGQEVFSPKDIVKADNNWEILLACLGGKTKEELEEIGITFTKSQLMLLHAMGFIDYIKDSNTEKIITTMPILGSKEKRSLIKKVRKLAYEIEPELKEDIYALKEALKKIGHEDHIFSILFSAVIDGIGNLIVPIIEMKGDDPIFSKINNNKNLSPHPEAENFPPISLGLEKINNN